MAKSRVKIEEKPFQKLQRLEKLLKSGRRYTLAEISQELSVNERSVFRYLERLELNGINVQKRVRGQKIKEYWISLQETDVDPDLLDAIRAMDSELTTNGMRKYHRLLKRIENALDDNTHKNEMVSNLVQGDFHFDNGPLAHQIGQDNNLHQMVDKLLLAIQNKSVVKITYPLDAENSRTTRFEFFPYRVFLRMGKLYLVGYHSKDEAVINLSIPRIKMLSVTRDFYEAPQFDLDSYFKYCFGQWVPRAKMEPTRVILQIKEDWVFKLFDESNFNPPALIKPRIRSPKVYLQVYLTPDFEAWLLGLLPAVEILEPLSLKQQLLQRCKTVMKSLK